MLFFSTPPSLEPGYIYVQNINATLLLATALSRNIFFHTSIHIYIYIYIYIKFTQKILKNLQDYSGPKIFDMEEDCIIDIDESEDNDEHLTG